MLSDFRLGLREVLMTSRCRRIRSSTGGLACLWRSSGMGIEGFDEIDDSNNGHGSTRSSKRGGLLSRESTFAAPRK